MKKQYIKDKYFKARGGTAQLLDVFCMDCSSRVLIYQKDGKGRLLRCYLNRIYWPNTYDPNIKPTKNLICGKCNSAIGVPMTYSDGRYAFRLLSDAFYRRVSEEDGEYE